MDYEVRGNRVIAHSADGTVVIDLTYEGERHLGSLDLPMTKVVISVIGFEEDKAKAFLDHYDKAMMRGGGGDLRGEDLIAGLCQRGHRAEP